MTVLPSAVLHLSHMGMQAFDQAGWHLLASSAGGELALRSDLEADLLSELAALMQLATQASEAYQTAGAASLITAQRWRLHVPRLPSACGAWGRVLLAW